MQEYETIKRARATLQASRSEPSARTVATYKRRAQVLMRHVIEQEGGGIDAMIAEAKRTRSASTWFGKRAAMVYGLRQGLETLLSEQHKLQRALKALDTAPSDERWEVWRNTVGKLAINIEWIERLEKEPGPPVGERKKRHSKRQDLRGLPDNWRERIVARMPRHRLAVLAQAVTGCRPEELVSGVQLEIRDGQLVATVNGAKVPRYQVSFITQRTCLTVRRIEGGNRSQSET